MLNLILCKALSSGTIVFFVTLATGCKRPDLTTVESGVFTTYQLSERAWFGENIKFSRPHLRPKDGPTINWARVANLINSKIYFSGLDLGVIATQNGPDTLRDVKSYFSTVWPDYFHNNLKNIQCINLENDADYIASMRIYYTETFSPLKSLVVSADKVSGFWFKVVEKKSNKTIFAYRNSCFFLTSVDNIMLGMKPLVRALESTKTQFPPAVGEIYWPDNSY